jgi:YihY family inner membrane protein
MVAGEKEPTPTSGQLEPNADSGRSVHLSRYPRALWRLSASRLREQNVTAMSASLSFRTIFALIPLLVMGLLVAKSLGALDETKRSLRSFLQASGFAQIIVPQENTPATSPTGDVTTASALKVINVADEIEKIATEVEDKLTLARVGPIGGLLLIWTAVGLLSTVEQSLNRIFGATRSRGLTHRLLLYWSVLTLSPIVLSAAQYLGEKAVATFGNTSGSVQLLAVLGYVGPFVILVLLLAAIYKLLPNTRVRYRSAIGGATVAALLWLVAKWGFGMYVDQLVLTGNLYGVLGALPLFMLWLYYSWLIFLAGAALADTAVHVRKLESAERAARTVLGPSDLLAAAITIVQSFQAGRGPLAFDDIVAQLGLPGPSVQWLMDRLNTGGLVKAVDDDRLVRYLPARPGDQIRVAEVLELADPRPSTAFDASYEPRVAAVVARVLRRTRTSLGSMTLQDALTGDADTADC